MAEVLSQNEIDALLSAVSSGDVDTTEENFEYAPTSGSMAQEGGGSKNLDWVAYDLTSQEKFVRGRLAALEGIHERFCRKFRTTLLNTLKKNISITYRSTEFIRFGEYLTNIVLPTSLNVISMEKPLGNMIFVVGSKLTYALVDAYYGGTERPFSKISGRDEFTHIEKQLIKKVIQLAVSDLEEAWRLNYPLKLNYKSTESNPHFVGSIHGSESVGVVNFEVEFENLSGPFIIIVPLRPLDPIRSYLSVNITREVEDNSAKWKQHWEKELGRLSLNIRVNLGQQKKMTKEILGLKVGDVLTLGQDAASPLDVLVEGLPKFRGNMGAYRGSAAVRIMDVAPFKQKG